jgi:RNA polymerase sigma-70 factor (ECF subfamily)
VRDAAAFLATTAKRLALNVAQSAPARRETSIDPRHPEPVDIQADPTLAAERREALELGVRMLMERLSGSERAAYVLREAFDYPYRQISEVLATNEANARQLANRARLRLAGSGPRRQAGAAEQQRFVDAFLGAAQTGDLTTLERVLAAQALTSTPVAIAA